MTRATIVGGAFATVLVLLALAAGHRALKQDVDVAPATEGLAASKDGTFPGQSGALRYPPQTRTGSGGYFANRASTSASPQRTKTLVFEACRRR